MAISIAKCNRTAKLSGRTADRRHDWFVRAGAA
jgi:hypothetical protein